MENGNFEYCNTKDIILSFIFFTGEDVSSFPRTLELASKIAYHRHVNNDDTWFTDNAYDPTWRSMGGGEVDYVNNNTNIAKAFDTFCNGECASFVWYMGAIYNDINSYLYDIPFLACNVSSYKPSVFAEMIEVGFA